MHVFTYVVNNFIFLILGRGCIQIAPYPRVALAPPRIAAALAIMHVAMCSAVQVLICSATN
jgi:hypothetical protein